MFNMGSGEMLLVGLIAMLLIPPKKLPEIATKLGRLLNELKHNFDEMKSTVTDSLKDTKPKDK